jgi:hypothetical protein
MTYIKQWNHRFGQLRSQAPYNPTTTPDPVTTTKAMIVKTQKALFANGQEA